MSKQRQQDNLISLANRTTAEQRKIASAGGKASGKARRRKREDLAQLRLFLDSSFDDGHGQQATGHELVRLSFLRALKDEQSRNWAAAFREYMRLISGDTDTELKREQIARLRAERELIEARTAAIKAYQADGAADLSDDGFIAALDATAATVWHNESSAGAQ